MADLRALGDHARRVLLANRLRGSSDWDGKSFDFVCPSRETYPFQWLWDSAFHAVALLHVNPELAKQEIRCLLQGSQPDGFLPHLLLWQPSPVVDQYSIVLSHPHFTATTQPPVIARAIARIFDATADIAFVQEVLPPVVRFFDWLARCRDPDGDGLIAIIQPDESGLDASPKFDVPMGLSGRASLVAPELKASMNRLFDGYAPFRDSPAKLLEQDLFQVEEIMFNAIYGDGLRCLARLTRTVGGNGAESLESRSAAVTRALAEKCWDDKTGVFWDLAGTAEKPLHVLTFTSLFPLILEDLDASIARRLVEDHLLEPAEFWTRYPVPSVAVDEPSFDPSFRSQAIWRGPTWVNANWYFYWGLRSHGYEDVATELANRTFEMVARGGQREFFNPFTAEGMGASDFSWTSLVLDLLAAEGKLT